MNYIVQWNLHFNTIKFQVLVDQHNNTVRIVKHENNYTGTIFIHVVDNNILIYYFLISPSAT